MTETFKDQEGVEWTVHRTSSRRISIEHPTRNSSFIIVSDTSGVARVSAQSVPPAVVAYALEVWWAASLAPAFKQVRTAADLTQEQRDRTRQLADVIMASGHGCCVSQCERCGGGGIGALPSPGEELRCADCGGPRRQVAAFLCMQHLEDWLAGRTPVRIEVRNG